IYYFFFFFQAEDGIRDKLVTGVQTCALPILSLYFEIRTFSRRLPSFELTVTSIAGVLNPDSRNLLAWRSRSLSISDSTLLASIFFPSPDHQSWPPLVKK